MKKKSFTLIELLVVIATGLHVVARAEQGP